MPGMADKSTPEGKQGLVVVRALVRGITLLRMFTPEEPRLSLATLSRRAELDKGTTRRLLHTLVLSNLVEMDSHSGDYYLSANIFQLAAAVDAGRDFRTVAAPWLRDIAQISKATVFLWIYHAGTALCVDRVCAPISAISGNWTNVGMRLTLNLGAGPRALLAWLDEDAREAALSGRLDTRTPETVTDPARLRDEIQAIRNAGWAMASDDFVVGLSAIGVPVFDSQGQLAGSISMTGLTQQITNDNSTHHVDLLLETAQKISHSLI